MTYEKKYKIAKSALDKLQVAFDDLSKAREEMREAYKFEYKRLTDIIDKMQKDIDCLTKENEQHIRSLNWYRGSLESQRTKTWWQKLKESIFRPA